MKQWIEREGNPALEAALVRDMHISSLLARLLVNRSIKSVEEARPFLYGTLDELHDPYMMRDMDKAVDRIQRAVRNGERIVIYADYDVDGITGAALLYKTLKMLGVIPDHYIPNRLSEGYGINENAIDRLRNYDLMISVDCGISDFHPIQRAKELGLDVIVTDHHKVPSELPPALAILNPQREDRSYPFSCLAGVGVVYKLVTALLETFGQAEEVGISWLDLVAMGTVADVVPILGENRILVKEGLARLQETNNPGIRALKTVSSLKGDKIGVYEIGYMLAPRINAASRMGKSELALTLMISDDAAQCASIAKELDILNKKRKSVEQEMLDDARVLLENESKEQKAVVLASEEWHPGVTGIVASRLKEETNCPVVLVSWDNSHNGKGTARSIPSFAITSALGGCKELLVSYGGHDAAAGFSIQRKYWEAFRNCFLKVVEQEIKEEDLVKKLFFDREIDLSDSAYDIISQIERLSPFGVRNPEPVFSTRDMRLVGTPREVGNNHLKLVLKKGRFCYDAIGFKMARFLPKLQVSDNGKKQTIDVVFSLRLNFWKGEEKIQLYLKDLIVH
jgi:single-stranded-DNA-specific exonuclease